MLTAHLLVGLGNPGIEYQFSRHNFGFLALDSLVTFFAERTTLHEISNKKDPFQLWKSVYCNQPLYFMKPLNFMNRSGESLIRVLHYYKLSLNNVLVLHDELDLAFGRMKFKFSGGNAGHNGLKSIEKNCGSPDFYRIRLGVGRPDGFNAASYVLGRFTLQEVSFLPSVFATISQVVIFYLQSKNKDAQQLCNSFHTSL